MCIRDRFTFEKDMHHMGCGRSPRPRVRDQSQLGRWASAVMARKAITLEPAALVNESFLKLIQQRNRYDNHGHFFAIASRVMLRVLIDYRRQRAASMRGGGRTQVTLVLDEQQVAGSERRTTGIDVERLADALA